MFQKWGSMKNGTAYALRRSVCHMAENESGLLPTPRKSDERGPSMVRVRAILRGDSAHRYQLREAMLSLRSSFEEKYAPPSLYERLMGYQDGHTALPPSEIPSSRRSRKSSGGRSSKQKVRLDD